ncbi:tyrosine-type recombinase/integrase [Phototrophicus methaneseepsis]|uniref:Tyrosine-type recombinase/integrase n=1 Tax=Phototrophicus methaneseepsis TaxID=2710758 RepID=A0A7S8E9Z6_9CHLR|nr:tyrosine-type recombinase/integrase [Phototrophicus methaneseepsis]QPC83106.1 tyrosine-type recombinase/integrase [Phototrophicus methaneseepsis]
MINSQLPDLIRRGQLPPHSDNKNIVSQVNRYNRWLIETGQALYLPDLTAYRDHLLTTLAPSSIRAHLSSIRRSYKLLIESLEHREALIAYLEKQFPENDFASVKAKADELELRLARAIDPERSQVATQTIQDEADSQHIRLTPAQGAALMMQPDVSTLRGRRDVAIIALMLATGLREGEVVKLQVDDLYLTYGGVPAVQVKSGKGSKTRMVPFGDMLWARQITEIWLAGRKDGIVFTKMSDGRGDAKQQQRTSHPMTTRSIQRMLGHYPIAINGIPTSVTPHDLRRSYARNLFLAGISMEIIRQNLGHVDVKTTQDYIGVLDGSTRAPVSVYDASMILKKLDKSLKS